MSDERTLIQTDANRVVEGAMLNTTLNFEENRRTATNEKYHRHRNNKFISPKDNQNGRQNDQIASYENTDLQSPNNPVNEQDNHRYRNRNPSAPVQNQNVSQGTKETEYDNNNRYFIRLKHPKRIQVQRQFNRNNLEDKQVHSQESRQVDDKVNHRNRIPIQTQTNSENTDTIQNKYFFRSGLKRIKRRKRPVRLNVSRIPRRKVL